MPGTPSCMRGVTLPPATRVLVGACSHPTLSTVPHREPPGTGARSGGCLQRDHAAGDVQRVPVPGHGPPQAARCQEEQRG